ncbi:nuclear transport factor 2 family protein [Arthrobacter sp. NPDC097144]|uniref:nuclear transport factor 2 family protein n=1 Tax=Arthrobacter sp. NPDC097144 TaxID=3363946 RepID=UPI00380F7F4D
METSPAHAATDVEQLQKLMHRYCACLDNGRLDELVSLFADDGVWDGSAWGLAEISGRADLRAFFQATINAHPDSDTVHLVFNHIIDTASDTASGTAYFQVFGLNPDGTRKDSLGQYTDEFVRIGPDWKFSRRSVRAVLAPPASEG